MIEYKITPWAHQQTAINIAKDLDHYALFFEMGCGKTSCIINILRYKFMTERKILRTLIFCPPIVVNNWKEEWGMHSKVPDNCIFPLTGPGKKREKVFTQNGFMLEHGSVLMEKQAIFITNYESLLMVDLYEKFKEWNPEVIIFDESHKLKSPSTKRTKLADKLANPKRGPRPKVFLLSGSPILNSPMDIFSQLKILDGGVTFGTRFHEFKKQYFEDRNRSMPRQNYFPNWQIKTAARDGFDGLSAINDSLKAVSMRVTKNDALDLPPLVRKTITTEMTGPQAKAYKEMERDFITYMESDHGDVPKAVVASMALTKGLRLMQIVSGFARTDKGIDVPFVGTPKLDALKQLLEELTPYHKVIVWAVWRHNYGEIREVCKSIGVKHVEVHGGVTNSNKLHAVNSFNTDDSVRVLLGHPGAGGIGINLVSASNAIFYSRNFSLEYDLQAEARNHRGGSEIHKKVTRIDLVCNATIDELVKIKLANKVNIGEKILRDLSHQLKGET